MGLLYEEQPSRHPAVQAIWRGKVTPGSYVVPADGCWDIIWCSCNGRTKVFVSGLATAAHIVTLPPGSHLVGVRFWPSFRLSHLQPADTIDQRIDVADSTSGYIRLGGIIFPPPHYDTLDQFVDQLWQHQLLLYTPTVHQALQEQCPSVSMRTLQRHFAKNVGVSYKFIRRIKRASRAATLLAAGTPPGDVVASVGFADQSHLTRELKHLQGVTPGRFSRITT